MADASKAQSASSFADSIRIKYNIPELGYAVVAADTVMEIQVTGVQRIHTGQKATPEDRFRIGSNTKTITAYLARVMVKQKKISWQTSFFDLYPELRPANSSAFGQLTLQDLLTFRAPLMSWTYTFSEPSRKEISGDNQQQRYEFVKWVLQQPPVQEKKEVYWSNPSFVAAGMMLEKVSGKSYEQLVAELGKELGIDFGFGPPNLIDQHQPWGHNEELQPEKPSHNDKLNWLSSAGNVNVSLPGYTKFIQMQLNGLHGKSEVLSDDDFEEMHFGRPEFAYGWKWMVDAETKLRCSYHIGNPGTFLSKVYIYPDAGIAFIVFTNIQSEAAEDGTEVLLDELKHRYLMSGEWRKD